MKNVEYLQLGDYLLVAELALGVPADELKKYAT